MEGKRREWKRVGKKEVEKIEGNRKGGYRIHTERKESTVMRRRGGGMKEKGISIRKNKY